MPRSRCLLLLACVLALAPLLIATPAGYGYRTYKGRHLTFGVVNQHFWIGPDAEANNHDAITQAMSAWNATPTPISYSRTGTRSQSRLDVTRVGFTDRRCAVTSHYVGTVKVNLPNGMPRSNWWWAAVRLRPSLKTYYLCGPAYHRAAVVAHEMGHAFGLSHRIDNSRTLMNRKLTFPPWWRVNNPRPDDVRGINALY